MDSWTLQIGDQVKLVHPGLVLRSQYRIGTVRAIQRRRNRAEVSWSDGRTTWHPTRLLTAP